MKAPAPLPLFAELAAECRARRRSWHSEPELSGGEYATRDVLAGELRALGFEPRTFPNHAGIIVDWPGTTEGPCVALRADMDALPLQEESGLEWASRRPGVMHACGHDGHMAILLGVARWLRRREKPFPRGVKLLFQPAEETGDGANGLIASGALEDPPVEAVFGLHGWPELEPGTVAAPERAVMAAVDNFTLRVRGRGGHGAMPHLARDPVVAAAQLIVQAQTLVSRRTPPWEGSVLTFGCVEAGRTHNVIPEVCLLKGTLRTLDPDLRRTLRAEFESLIRHVSAAQGVETAVDWIESCPPTVNHPEMAALVKAAAIGALGPGCWREIPPSMGGEDFGVFLERVPGAYFWLGLGLERGPLHNPRFDFNDTVLAAGIAVFAGIVERFMEGKG